MSPALTVLHGSEDHGMPGEETSPITERSRRTNPLYQGAGRQLEHYDTQELTSYFERVVRDPELVANIMLTLGEIDGHEWTGTMTLFDEERTLTMLEEDLNIVKKLTGARLIADARRAQLRVEAEEKQHSDEQRHEKALEESRLKKSQEDQIRKEGSTV